MEFDGFSRRHPRHRRIVPIPSEMALVLVNGVFVHGKP
jgi:hypothetical protein